MRNLTILLILVTLSFSGAYAGISLGNYFNADVKFSLDTRLSVGNTSFETHTSTGGLTWGDDDYYYDYDDDFYYSRRLRRFHSTRPARAGWSYYDPYFTNDIYFVIGTPYWNLWCSRYDPWQLRRRYAVSNTWSWGPTIITTNVVYSTGWNPWGYDPFFYDYCAYGGGFYNYSYTTYYSRPWRSSWGYSNNYNRGYNRGYRNGYRNGYNNGYANGYYRGYNNGYASAGSGYSNDYWYRRSGNGNPGSRYAGSTNNSNIRNNAPQRQGVSGRNTGGYNGEERVGQLSPRSTSGTSGRLAAPSNSNTSGRATTINRNSQSGNGQAGQPRYVTPGYERESRNLNSPNNNSNVERRTYSAPERTNTYSAPRSNSGSNVERRTYSAPERTNTYSAPRSNSGSNVERRTYSAPERTNTYTAPRSNNNSYSAPRSNSNSGSSIERRSTPSSSPQQRSNTYSAPRSNSGNSGNVSRPSSGSNSNSRTASPSTIRRGN
ncbi:MAG: hypothetical protein R3C61_24395 [Bacteroidia bacterium]